MADVQPPSRAELVAHFDFPLDPFQLRALDALDGGSSVLVAAPTGSGKTVVAEYAIDVGAAPRPAGVLHRADQGAVEPEVPRPRRAPRRRRPSACSPATTRSTATRRWW